MCGIVGYIGEKKALPILIEGLKKLEYRGYDSAGIALFKQDQTISTLKAKGPLSALESLSQEQELHGTVGIGHTRWATHGEVNLLNAHPHTNESQTIALVHNGIIENHMILKEHLSSLGYRFVSQTDTETAVHLIDHYYQAEKDPLKAIQQTLGKIQGSYAFAILFADHPDTIYAARKDSPLAIGCGENENFIASDAPAILKHTKRVVYLNNLEIAVIRQNSIRIYDLSLQEVHPKETQIEWDIESAEKNGFAHFMLKEIHEQPAALRSTLSAYLQNGKLTLNDHGLSPNEIQALHTIRIVACGSAYHAGIVAKYVIESLARIPVEVDLASEFRYRDPILEKNSLCIVISQSGETADTLAALREAKRKKITTIAIVNVIGSSIAREADHVFLTHAGPEISVATTKAYSAQLVACYLVALYLAEIRQTINQEELAACLREVEQLPEKIDRILQEKESIQKIAQAYADQEHIFFIGRGIDYAAALEGALKLKEISYIHAEAYAAGELKHGTLSLIENKTPVIALATQPALYEKILSNTAEVICRGADLFALTDSKNNALTQNAKQVLLLPKTHPLFAASLSVIPLQLFAYYVSLAKGVDVDKPRNLAKSVTVE